MSTDNLNQSQIISKTLGVRKVMSITLKTFTLIEYIKLMLNVILEWSKSQVLSPYWFKLNK